MQTLIATNAPEGTRSEPIALGAGEVATLILVGNGHVVVEAKHISGFTEFGEVRDCQQVQGPIEFAVRKVRGKHCGVDAEY